MYQHFLKKSYLLFQHKDKKHNFVIVILFLDWKFWPNEIKSFYYRILIWHKYIVQECTWISSSAVETWFLHFYSITSLIVIDEQHISDELQVHLNHALPIQGNIVTLGTLISLINVGPKLTDFEKFHPSQKKSTLHVY